MDVRERVAELEGLGYDPIPLHAGTKRPLMADWPRLAPAVQWAAAPFDANVGLRGGGELHAAFLDCDDRTQPGTADTVRRILAGMGYLPDGDYPFTRTASGLGGHIYVRLTATLPGNYRELRHEVGAGELRYGPGSMVVAPGSVVGGQEYALLAGDLRQLPALDPNDIREFITLDTAPTSTPVPTIPRLAYALLTANADTLARYATRSEAEQACLASLIGAGHDFASIVVLFMTHPCAGKFAELRRKSEESALRWLRRSYSTATAWSEKHESAGRTLARQAQQWALSAPWPGRTGSTDRAVFLAHTEIARAAGALTYAASVRRLAELAGVNAMTAVRANRRLVAAGTVAYDTAHIGTLASLYTLAGVMRRAYTSSQSECVEVYALRTTITADAFRYRGLGKAALEVWTHLQAQPGMTAGELTTATGRNRSTVNRALARMARLVDPASGEVLRLVERDGDGWRAVTADLEAVARAVGTTGTGTRQRAKHDGERAGFRRAMARARAADTPERAKD